MMYANLNSFTKKLTNDKRFELIEFNKIKSNIKNIDSMKFSPQIGDLLYRKGHVEFYVGHNKTIGWGRVHKACLIAKKYCIDEDGIKSNDPEDKNIPYTTIIRFMGGTNEK